MSKIEIEITNELEDEFEKYLIDLEESINTIKQYQYSLKTYKKEIGNKLSKQNLKQYKDILLNKRKPKTVNVRIAGIIKFIKFYAEYKKDKRYEEIIIKNIKMQNKTYLNNVISLDEFKKMYEYCKDNNQEKYYYIIKFMGYTGARISEVVKCDKKSVEQGYMEIISKGNKFRRIYIPQNFQRELLNWIKSLNIEGYIFKNKNGQVITTRGISQQLKRIANILKINDKKVHPHSFRHLFAIEFLKNNKDITLLADLLGHSNLDTTKIYLRRTEEEQIKIINEINW